MVETLTPAGCGGRHRRLLAAVLFAIGALVSAALLGAALGLLGGLVPLVPALIVVGGLALAGAAGEAGLIPRVLPTIRRQVPESWRRRWPLPAWSLAYGAGLGVGCLTHQVTTTYWIAAAGALAIGDPLWSAAAFAAFGLGRAVVAIVPALRSQPALAVEGLARRRRLVGPANAIVLVLVALLLFAGAATAQRGAPAPTGAFDPSLSGSVLAHAVREGNGDELVRIRNRRGRVLASVPDARSPSVDGRRVAVETSSGIDVIEWSTGRRLARITGPVGKPALDWPRLAYVRTGASRRSLVLRDLLSRARRTITSVRAGDDLGRPALDGARVAWHHATGRSNLLFVRPIARRGRVSVVASSRTVVHVNPSLDGPRLLWVESRASTSIIWTRRLDRPRSRTRRLGTIRGRRIFWTTALAGRRAVVTRWSLRATRAELVTRRV